MKRKRKCLSKLSSTLWCQKNYGHKGKCFCAEPCDNGTVMLRLEWAFVKIKKRGSNDLGEKK